ncbi:L,D-transpeptidase family protein [Rhodobacter sp. Har01]|uniref:L,D-transpeptidase family protein n=1 Tax=Rhodobacter sp. Har01 TaxID=2883999 RepID=UPI001D08D3FD|nr:L,D-transpeptidase family protein [Rhodobacter sp. Har01]MCB6178021.1 L,D-transpeptidase family protein [Rhodobacter sp. Har01]
MRALRVILVLLVVVGLAGCSSKFKRYYGPEVTSVQVHKTERKMYLLHNDKVLKSYDVGLGFAPEGHKQFEGDGKTPEGTYTISHKNPGSDFHLSLRVSYPNDIDRAYASSMGKEPGGDIFIHGGPRQRVSQRDWTAGCIAVTDRQIEVIYSMIKPGTPIHILP